MTTKTPSFTEADLDQLETLLDDPAFGGEPMLLDELQAMFCAILSSPQPVPPAAWLPAALGGDFSAEPSVQVNEVIDLMMRFYNALAETLAEGEGLELILYPDEEETENYDFATWAEAYLFGTQLSGNWYELAGDHAEQLSELMEPVFLLSGILKEDAEEHGEPWMSPAQEQAAMEGAADDLPEVVQAIYGFWQAKRQSDQAVDEDLRRKGKSLSQLVEGEGMQDESCPCGSGKHFRQCCGRPERLH